MAGEQTVACWWTKACGTYLRTGVQNVTGKFDTRGYDPAQAFNNGDLGDKGWLPKAHQQVFGLLIFL